MRWGMVIEASKCVCCDACTVACKLSHGAPPGIWLSKVIEREEGKYPNVSRWFLPILCGHCLNPPCVKACPNGALRKRPDGIVVVNSDKCSGMRACTTACPYGALHFYNKPGSYFGLATLTPIEKFLFQDKIPGTVLKCDFCAPLVDSGQLPACVNVCPTLCRKFGDLDDPTSEVSRLVRGGRAAVLNPDLGASPSVYYIF